MQSPFGMDPISVSAAAGMRSRMEALDLLSNNLANTETGGYKADREFYNLFTSPDATGGPGTDAARLPDIERNWIDLTQGPIRNTDNPLDFALEGKGFFAVDGPSGVMYTRQGSFHIDNAGLLVTSDGYPVRNAAGAQVRLALSPPPDVTADGSVMQNGTVAGRLALVDFRDQRQLSKQGKAYFTAQGGVAPEASSAVVHQRKLEGSNVGSAESAIRLVSIMRQFEMMQRAASISSDMNKKAVEDVARV